MYKVAVFDLDGTLIEYESSWQTLHTYFGVSECNVEKNLNAYMQGQISYLRWMELDIALWLHMDPTLDDVKKAFSNHDAPQASKDALKMLHENGIKTYIVSSGIDILASKIASQLGIDGVFANRLLADENGYLSGTGECIVEPLEKHRNIRSIASLEDVALNEIVCIGDTKYDISMFKGVGGKIALNAKHDELIRASDACFESIGNVASFIVEQ